MLIRRDKMTRLPFKPFRKVSLVRVRPLTEDDYTLRKGVIRTLEGQVAFHPGDYLACGIKNEEWPITKKHMVTDYEYVSGPDAEGFSCYRALNTRLALQIHTRFTVQYSADTILTGRAGDYLVRSGENVWITEQNVFERSYEQV